MKFIAVATFLDPTQTVDSLNFADKVPRRLWMHFWRWIADIYNKKQLCPNWSPACFGI